MIHVVGNAAIDTVFRVDRFPLPGETVIADGLAEDLGGKGANQAVIIARAGVPVRLVAAVGDDQPGAMIRTSLAAEGVGIDGLRTAAGATDRSSIYVDATGENTIVSATARAAAFDPAGDGALDGVGRGDVVLCQGNLGVAALRAVLALARAAGATTVLNPSPTRGLAGFDWRLADLVVVNRVEAIELAGLDTVDAALDRMHGMGAGSVVATIGRDGALMAGEANLAVPAVAVEAVDTTGAGDVFCGMLTAMRASGRPWRTSLAIAAEAAAVKVTRRGVLAAFPSAGEIAAIVARHEGADG